MADNYIENKFEQLQARREKEKKARQAAWKKRMDAYRKKLEEQKAAEENDLSSVARLQGNLPDEMPPKP
ncbi:MAG: hypothetical protein ACI3ZL_05555 [Candidatus Cryptobacteroides sp.]